MPGHLEQRLARRPGADSSGRSLIAVSPGVASIATVVLNFSTGIYCAISPSIRNNPPSPDPDPIRKTTMPASSRKTGPRSGNYSAYDRLDKVGLVRLMNEVYSTLWHPLQDHFCPSLKLKRKATTLSLRFPLLTRYCGVQVDLQ